MEQRTKFKKKIDTTRGITLIALVITIIILLILAGISIGMLTGENGILTKASKAKEESKKAEYQEEIQLIITEKKIEKTTNLEETRTLIELVVEGIRQKEWQKSVTICDEDGNDNIKPAEGCKIIVETKDGYEIIVKIDNENMTGEIESITKGTGKTWKVTFDKNKGEGKEPEAIEKRQGFSILLPDGKTLSRTGYKFVGWSEDKDAKEKEETIYAEGSAYRPVKDTTLYAIWSETAIKINFNANTGEGNMDSINVLPGNSTKLTKNGYTKDGYRFKEWNTKSDGTGTKYEDEATIENITEDMTLYAIWEEEIFATLIVTGNKFTEGTKITLGGQAQATGIQKVELKVGNNILYLENLSENNANYSKTNLGLEELVQESLQNLAFYDVTLQLSITSITGSRGSTNVAIKNYTIGNNEALRQFAQVVNNGNSLNGETIIQLTDVKAGGNDLPIGTWVIDSNEGKPFSGIYDGKNHSIYLENRSFNREYAKGVFGYIEGATIKNLIVNGYLAYGSYSGGVCGTAWSSTIQDCSFQGFSDDVASGIVRAGIVAYAGSCNISRCWNKYAIKATECVGGIGAWVTGNTSKINECFNLGDIQSNGKNESNSCDTGGIVGAFGLGTNNSELSNCYNVGNISGTYRSVGGLLGSSTSSLGGRLDIRNCYNVGKVSGTTHFGPCHGYVTLANYYNTYHIVEDPNSSWDGCTWDNKTGKVSSNNLKTMAGTLGSSYKADTGINSGFPIFIWQ